LVIAEPDTEKFLGSNAVLRLNDGIEYKYAHDYPNHWVEQQYLPDKMLGTKYYIKDDTVED
jgi:replication-associated recombination protein RarA